MKPDWKDAPEWAQWLAQDSDGDWWWYAVEPLVVTEESGMGHEVQHSWSPQFGTQCEVAGHSQFELPIEERP